MLFFTARRGSDITLLSHLFHLLLALIFRDSAVCFGHGAQCSSEFSVRSDMLCDLSVSITKKRLYCRKKVDKQTHTNMYICTYVCVFLSHCLILWVCLYIYIVYKIQNPLCMQNEDKCSFARSWINKEETVFWPTHHYKVLNNDNA